MANNTYQKWVDFQRLQGEFTEDGELKVDFKGSLLEPPYNATDPYVIFDPTAPTPQAAVSLHNTDVDTNEPEQRTKIDGIKTPILIINSMAVDPKLIKEFDLRTTEFMPTLEFTLHKGANKQIESIGAPGLANMVICIMTPQFSGLHRKIALPFYIKERSNEKLDTIKYTCVYHNSPMDNVLCEQIGSKQLTTFELCEKVAMMCGLGFAATDKCEDISDPQWRQIYSQPVSEYIQEQVKGGGSDDAIFDCWIDTHGYLVLVNLDYIFTADIKPNNLMIAEQTGADFPTPDSIEGDPFRMLRLISNYKDVSVKNLLIMEYYPDLDTNSVREQGTECSYWYLDDVGGQNRLVQEDVKSIELTLDGVKYQELYKFSKTEYLGARMCDIANPEIQKRIRDSWLKKRAAKRLCVILYEMNLGLERGTLINVFIQEDQPQVMAQQLRNQNNVMESNEDENPDEQDYAGPMNTSSQNTGPDQGTAMYDEAMAANVSYTGMYYINGIIYHYDKTFNRFIQYLFLIPASFNNQLFGFSTNENISTEQGNIISTDTPHTTLFSDSQASDTSGVGQDSLSYGQNMINQSWNKAGSMYEGGQVKNKN